MRSYINIKGFKIIETTGDEIKTIGGYGICDSCCRPSSNGYLIPALGSYWYCEKCYEEWIKNAVIYDEDKEFEARVFDKWVTALKEQGIMDDNERSK